MKTDLDILRESYNKYKDKSGIKAQNLSDRIKCHEAFSDLIKQIKDKKRWIEEIT